MEDDDDAAAYYMDDRNSDPETALSYLDKKVENVLGHFQKYFEGGVSAENLGPKFGGYGSFLTTACISHQSSEPAPPPPPPPILSQTKSPPNNHGTFIKNPVEKVIPLRQNKSINLTDQGKLKFRIRVKSSDKIATNNADEISATAAGNNKNSTPLKKSVGISLESRDVSEPEDKRIKETRIQSLLKTAALLEQDDELCKAAMKNKLEISKKKSRMNQGWVNNAKLCSDSVQESGRRVGSSLVAKEKKRIVKEINTKPSVADMLEKKASICDRLKNPKLDTVNVGSDKNPSTGYNLPPPPPPPPPPPLPEDGSLLLLSEQAATATCVPEMIPENWVFCDRCRKWRLLPYGTDPAQLPEKWLCSMLYWLPGMNRCDISEEETTKALNSLYEIPVPVPAPAPPENQNGAQYQPAEMADGRNKQQKFEISNKGRKAGLNPAAKDDLKQQKQKLCMGVKKSDNSKNYPNGRQKQEHVPGGNANNLKRKFKRESDQFVDGNNAKRFKSNAISNNLQDSGENLGKTGGVGSNPAKEKQRTSEPKAGDENSLQSSVRQRADSGVTMSLDMKKKCNDGENSAKRRNLVAPGAVKSDGSYLSNKNKNNKSMVVKEKSSDSEFKRRKDMMNRPLLSSGGRENKNNTVAKKKYKIKIAASHPTMEKDDLESLKKDLDLDLDPKPLSSSTTPAGKNQAQDIVGPTNLALKEAEELRDYADRLKNTGFDHHESNEVYFEAALKFMHAASLFEMESNESGKLGEIKQIQIYTNTAKLCETLVQEYEKAEQMSAADAAAAAALAYKCMEVAYMRVVYFKNSSTINRVWHDLLTSIQVPTQGESPSPSSSSFASDIIDDLNNQAFVGSLNNRQNFARLFEFTEDVNSAMEACRKSHVAFSLAANAILDDDDDDDETQNKNKGESIIVCVKRVIDFSFQDVQEFVRLVRIAVEAISRQKFSSSRN